MNIAFANIESTKSKEEATMARTKTYIIETRRWSGDDYEIMMNHEDVDEESGGDYVVKVEVFDVEGMNRTPDEIAADVLRKWDQENETYDILDELGEDEDFEIALFEKDAESGEFKEAGSAKARDVLEEKDHTKTYTASLERCDDDLGGWVNIDDCFDSFSAESVDAPDFYGADTYADQVDLEAMEPGEYRIVIREEDEDVVSTYRFEIKAKEEEDEYLPFTPQSWMEEI